jgi:predicted metal-binding membrane protein
MPDPALEMILRRDRTIVAVSLVALTVLAWLYLLSLAQTMGPAMGPGISSMPADGMGGMSGMVGMEMPGTARSMAAAPVWSAGDAAFVLAMWCMMMVGMMLPSAAPMILLYARVGRHAAAQGAPFAATGIFAAGYLAVWFLFSLAATAGQWALDRALLLTPMMESGSTLLNGTLLIAAGLYQWTPLKHACLSKCRAPVVFLHEAGGFRRDPAGAFAMGMRHGAYCVGCCWPLMLLLFVGGVMNILWIAAIAILVLAEKVMPGGDRIGRIAGALLVGAGVWFIVRGLQ